MKINLKQHQNIFINLLKKIKANFVLIMYSYYDYLNFFNNSSVIVGINKNKDTLLGAITIDYHRLEKGLTLKEVKPKFGMWFIPSLINNIIEFKKKYGDHIVIEAALAAISSYLDFHKKNKIEIIELNEFLIQLNSFFPGLSNKPSVLKLNIEDILKITSRYNFEEFTNSRHSIRSFSNDKLDIELIKKAVKIAIKTPSVCNRQPWRVYYIKGEKVQKLLKYQNGNNGFHNEIKNLVIIVGKLSYMQQPSERHQIFIDGGMFSMSLIYAFHSQNIASCALNWCVNPKTDKLLRTTISIEKDEEPIMYIAIGMMNKETLVTKSPRLEPENILNIIN